MLPIASYRHNQASGKEGRKMFKRSVSGGRALDTKGE